MNMLISSNHSYFKPCDQTSFLSNVASGASDGFEVGTYFSVLTSILSAVTTRDGILQEDEYDPIYIAFQLSTFTVMTAVTTTGLTTGLGAAFGAGTNLLNRAYCYLPETDTVTSTMSNIFDTAVSYLPSKEQAYEYCPGIFCGRDEL